MFSALLARADSWLARLRTLGWRGLFAIEQDTLLRLVKTTVAATVAWQVADALGSPRPALASLAAILVVQVTVRASLARSIQLTVGVTLGLVLAVVLGHLLGAHWWTILLIVLGGLLLAEILRLGPLGVQAPISALLAFSLGSGYGLVRVTDTLYGAAIGVLVNALIAPPSHVAKTAGTLRLIAADLGALLVDIGNGVGRMSGGNPGARWLERARAISADVRDARESLLRAQESVRFNPLTRATTNHLDRLIEARRALDHASTQVRGMTRTFMDLLSGRELAVTEHLLLRLLAAPMVQAGHAVAAFGRLQEDPNSSTGRAQAVAARTAAKQGQVELNRVLGDLSSNGDLQPGSALLLSSIAVDLERLIDEVDVENGPHTAAVTPEPA